MTRFAKGGQKRKRPLDATSWNDLKGNSKQQTENTGDKNTHGVGTDKQATAESGKTTAFKHSGDGGDGVFSQTTQDPKGDKRKPFIKGNRRQRDFECYNCKGKDHKAADCPQPSDGKNDSIVCHACKGTGHKAFKCPNSQGSDRKGRRPGPYSQASGPGRFNKQNGPVKEFWNKEKRSEWRRSKREKERETKRNCFNCRSVGHLVSECPELKKDVEQGTGICFKCGSTEHSIHECRVKLPKDKFPYAKCFICNETGHLSKQCPDNPRGLYPDGGCCKQCGSVEHLKRDCPEYQSKQGIGDIKLGRLDTGTSGDIEGFGVPAKKQKKIHKPSGTKTVTF